MTPLSPCLPLFHVPWLLVSDVPGFQYSCFIWLSILALYWTTQIYHLAHSCFKDCLSIWYLNLVLSLIRCHMYEYVWGPQHGILPIEKPITPCEALWWILCSVLRPFLGYTTTPTCILWRGSTLLAIHNSSWVCQIFFQFGKFMSRLIVFIWFIRIDKEWKELEVASSVLTISTSAQL